MTTMAYASVPRIVPMIAVMLDRVLGNGVGAFYQALWARADDSKRVIRPKAEELMCDLGHLKPDSLGAQTRFDNLANTLKGAGFISFEFGFELEGEKLKLFLLTNPRNAVHGLRTYRRVSDSSGFLEQWLPSFDARMAEIDELAKQERKQELPQKPVIPSAPHGIDFGWEVPQRTEAAVDQPEPQKAEATTKAPETMPTPRQAAKTLVDGGKTYYKGEVYTLDYLAAAKAGTPIWVTKVDTGNEIMTEWVATLVVTVENPEATWLEVAGLNFSARQFKNGPNALAISVDHTGTVEVHKALAEEPVPASRESLLPKPTIERMVSTLNSFGYRQSDFSRIDLLVSFLNSVAGFEDPYIYFSSERKFEIRRKSSTSAVTVDAERASEETCEA